MGRNGVFSKSSKTAIVATAQRVGQVGEEVSEGSRAQTTGGSEDRGERFPEYKRCVLSC